jgi:uncharacterized protein involved in exopolysaccharide biosynthesis
MNPFANGITPELLLGMLKRRVWIAVSLLSLILSATVGLVLVLPDIYTARALILVEGQQIPQEYVRSTVTMGVERRIQVISQEILSRSRLVQLVKEFSLYEDLRQKEASEDLLATAMRKDIAINITGKGGQGDTVAFEINFTNPDPQKVMQIANTELIEVKRRLDAQEQQVAEYKKRYMGELPEQMNANLSTLGVLQKQMEILSDNLNRARERRNVLAQMAEMDAALASLDMGSASTGNARLEGLKKQLAELKLRFADKHPDVIRLKQQIAALEEEEKSRAEAAPSVENLNIELPKASSASVEQAAIDAEIKSLSESFAKVQQEIAIYKQRIENAPRREQEMLAITRDYNATRDLYASLLKRLDEANLADSLEQRQKAERFRILEPAVYPQQPAGPKRLQLLLFGVMLSMAVAAAGVVVSELLNTSFHRVEDLSAFTSMPILGTVPLIVTAADSRRAQRRQWFGAVALAMGIAVIFGTSYWLGTGNEQLVRKLVRPGSGVQLR